MSKIAIVTDSTADLSPEQLAELDVRMVSLLITLEGTTYADQVDLSTYEFYELTEKSASVPSTASPSPQAFLDVYNELLEEGYTSCLSIHISEAMSSTITSARQAAALTELDVRCIDSLGTSGQTALQVMAARTLINKGKTIDEIEVLMDEYRKESHIIFIPPNMKNLVKSGRLSKAGEFAAGLLNIKIIVGCDERGAACVIRKARGWQRIIEAMTDEVVQSFKKHGKLWVAYGIVGPDDSMLPEMKKRLVEAGVDFIDKGIIRVGSTITSHVGIGCFGYAFGPAVTE